MGLTIPCRACVVVVFCGAGFMTFPLSGRVVGEDGNPVEGVSLELLVGGESARSLADGTFSFANAALGRAVSVPACRPITITGSRATVSVASRSAHLAVDVFDCTGRRAARLFDGVVAGGKHQFDLRNVAASAGRHLVHCRIGLSQFVVPVVLGIRAANLTEPFTQEVPRAPLADARSGESPGDTLLLTKPGHIEKRITVADGAGSLGDVVLFDSLLKLTPETFPRIDGSTTTISLSRLICCELMNVAHRWVAPARIPDLWEIVPSSGDTSLNAAIARITKHSKTHQSYDSLTLGTRDLILVARAPSQDELDAAAALGVTLQWRPMGLDALVMIVGSQNPVTAVSTENILGIYSRRATNWNQVGGPDLVILPYQREPNSGSQEMMMSVVMRGAPIDSTIPVLVGMMTVFDMIKYSNRSISFTPHYYKEIQVRDTLVRSLSVDGIHPDHTTIGNRSYPHCAEFFFVTRSDLEPTSVTAKLADWLLAPEGQKVVDESGYVPLR